MHSHSRSCRKYKKGKCRYHFGKFFTGNIIIGATSPVTFQMNSGRFFTKSVKDYCRKWRNIDKKLGLPPPPQKKKKTEEFELNKRWFWEGLWNFGNSCRAQCNRVLQWEGVLQCLIHIKWFRFLGTYQKTNKCINGPYSDFQHSDQNNSERGHLSRSAICNLHVCLLFKSRRWNIWGYETIGKVSFGR